MKRTLLLASALCLAAAACARPDTVYVAHGAAHTPRIELADGHAIEPRPMPGDTLTAGGVCCDEVNPYTMESLKVRGLYFAGEVLDLDANTGGYNLQIAFSTGRLAGMLKK